MSSIRSITFAVYVVVAVLALPFLANGQQQETTVVAQHPLTDMPPASEDIETSFYFPEHPDQKLPIGELMTVLCHFSNDGMTPLNVTAVMGSLHSPFDHNFHIQNFTYRPYGVVVKGGEEITLEYQFQLHPSLEPVDYTLSHHVFYESETEPFSSTFFNQTVELYLPVSDFDLESVFQVLFALLSTVFVGYLVYLACMPDKPLPIAVGKGGVPVSTRDFFDDSDDVPSAKKSSKGGKNKNN